MRARVLRYQHEKLSQEEQKVIDMGIGEAPKPTPIWRDAVIDQKEISRAILSEDRKSIEITFYSFEEETISNLDGEWDYIVEYFEGAEAVEKE